MSYELFYWPGLQGRGELVRLALEDTDTPYVDVARSPSHGGMKALQKLLAGEGVEGPPPFAPPFLRSGDLVVAQTANILQYLAPRIGLVGDDEPARLRGHQLQLTIMDLYSEAHDTHHPLGSSLYYEDQKPEAKRRTQTFLKDRLPKFLDYFERVIERTVGPFALEEAHSYVDLSLFQVLEGLRYAFPHAMKKLEPSSKGLVGIHARVAKRPRLAEYLASTRRLPFNETGIFRRYPELDTAADHAK